MNMFTRFRLMLFSAVCLTAGSVLAVPATLNLLTDIFGGETSFSMVLDPTGAVTAVPFDSASPSNTNLTDGFASSGDLVSSTSYVFEWDLAPGDYEFTINDSFGDGICCSFGSGNYSLTVADTTYNSPTGGAFGSIETIRFSAVPLPATLALLGLGLAGLGWSRRRANV